MSLATHDVDVSCVYGVHQILRVGIHLRLRTICPKAKNSLLLQKVCPGPDLLRRDPQLLCGQYIMADP